MRPICDLIIGCVIRFHIADVVYEGGHIMAEKLNPVSRLAGSTYALLGNQFDIERPL